MRIERLGDQGFILRDLACPPAALAKAAENVRGVFEAVTSYDTVGVSAGPELELSDLEDLELTCVSVATVPIRHSIPVCYALGEDLEEAAATLSLTTQEVIALHSGGSYTCAAIGFCPGFPYLAGLPPRLQGLPRRGSPRPRVEPGSVAITRDQAGIYPLPRPGGWTIVGRTPLVLVDVEQDYFPISAGDVIRFVPIDSEEFEARKGERL